MLYFKPLRYKLSSCIILLGKDKVFDKNLPSGEPNENYNMDNAFDFNVGIKWARQFERVKPSIGISLFHINTPGESFLENNSTD